MGKKQQQPKKKCSQKLIFLYNIEQDPPLEGPVFVFADGIWAYSCGFWADGQLYTFIGQVHFAVISKFFVLLASFHFY